MFVNEKVIFQPISKSKVSHGVVAYMLGRELVRRLENGLGLFQANTWLSLFVLFYDGLLCALSELQMGQWIVYIS